MRRAVLGIVIVMTATGCTGGHDPGALVSSLTGPSIVVRSSASPYSEITAGPVHALVPDGWHARAADGPGAVDGGFVASPRPDAWRRMDGSASGMAATWVDATRVGVPSDFYYLAAHGRLLTGLTDSADCRPGRQRVLLDHRPSFASGGAGSPGDYLASGRGTCRVGTKLTRWAYIVAAPGFGPLRRVGIPSSGLYLVVAVLRDSTGAGAVLHRLITSTSFGGTSVPDLLATARGKLPA